MVRPARLSPGIHLVAQRHPGRWLVALAAVALLGAAALWWDGRRGADSIDGVFLTGPRQSYCLRMVVGNDVSGSMTDFAAARESALSDFLGWAPDNLRPNDEVGVIDFAGAASWTRVPTPIGSSAVRGPARDVYVGDQTLLMPVLDRVAELPSSPCHTVLVLFSDAQLSDLPPTEEEGRSVLQAAGLDGVVLLVPGDDIDVPDVWTTVFPAAEPQSFDGLDADETGLTVASVVAELTGQDLAER
jgi:hypothetical protein